MKPGKCRSSRFASSSSAAASSLSRSGQRARHSSSQTSSATRIGRGGARRVAPSPSCASIARTTGASGPFRSAARRASASASAYCCRTGSRRIQAAGGSPCASRVTAGRSTRWVVQASARCHSPGDPAGDLGNARAELGPQSQFDLVGVRVGRDRGDPAAQGRGAQRLERRRPGCARCGAGSRAARRRADHNGPAAAPARIRAGARRSFGRFLTHRARRRAARRRDRDAPGRLRRPRPADRGRPPRLPERRGVPRASPPSRRESRRCGRRRARQCACRACARRRGSLLPAPGMPQPRCARVARRPGRGRSRPRPPGRCTRRPLWVP